MDEQIDKQRQKQKEIESHTPQIKVTERKIDREVFKKRLRTQN